MSRSTFCESQQTLFALQQARRMRRARSAGFTLIELMLAVTMLSIVMYMTLDSLTRQNKTAIVTDQIVEVQNNIRAVSGLLEREIRMAGFMVGNSVGACGVDSTTGPDQLFVSEAEAIVPDDARAGDMGARLNSGNWNTGNAAGETGLVITLDATTRDLDQDGTFFYDNDDNGTNESDFRENGGFIGGDIANPHRGTICGTITDVTASTIEVDILAGAIAGTVASDAPEDFVIVPAAHYEIETAAGVGRLVRNQDLLVNGVDEFQVSYFFDNNDDGIVDNGGAASTWEERGTLVGGVDSPYDPANEDNSALRELRFSIVLRTRAGDADFNAGQFINLENRAAVAGTDNFRRRVIEGAVRPRNIGAQGSI